MFNGSVYYMLDTCTYCIFTLYGRNICMYFNSQHWFIIVVLFIFVASTDECAKDELQCIDGNCVPPSKVCNFVNDCLHGTDEQHCGK